MTNYGGLLPIWCASKPTSRWWTFKAPHWKSNGTVSFLQICWFLYVKTRTGVQMACIYCRRPYTTFGKPVMYAPKTIGRDTKQILPYDICHSDQFETFNFSSHAYFDSTYFDFCIACTFPMECFRLTDLFTLASRRANTVLNVYFRSIRWKHCSTSSGGSGGSGLRLWE